MNRLEPVVFNDAWGSHVAIPSLQGRPIPSPEPESELWMGAHEEGPAGVEGTLGQTLADVVAADPQGTLGADARARFGDRLPFLLKVLAAGRAISIQVHPTHEQAVAERARSGSEVYVDDWAKPELLLAISPFEVFVGLRSAEESAAFIKRLGVPRLVTLAERAAGAEDPVHALLADLLATPAEDVGLLTEQVVAGCVRVQATDDEFGSAAAGIVGVAEDHPHDIGLAVLVLMHHRLLQPGEFIDVAAGVMHSYVHGLAIEVLANSDNVVRAGLTAKPVNVPELLRVVDTAADGIAGRPRHVAGGLEAFDTASDRFALHRLPARGRCAIPGDGGPRIVFCLRGSVELAGAGGTTRLADVESVFVRADEAAVEATCDGEVYVVSVPAP